MANNNYNYTVYIHIIIKYFLIFFLLQVNVSTIAGSRHVGPIKPRVEEWGKKLALFAETLVKPMHKYKQ